MLDINEAIDLYTTRWKNGMWMDYLDGYFIQFVPTERLKDVGCSLKEGKTRNITEWNERNVVISFWKEYNEMLRAIRLQGMYSQQFLAQDCISFWMVIIEQQHIYKKWTQKRLLKWCKKYFGKIKDLPEIKEVKQ